jgi:hypothetical protein
MVNLQTAGWHQAEKMTTESGYSLGAGNASSFKNRLINGQMLINQRGLTSSTAQQGAESYLGVDRWRTYFYGVGVATQAQVADAPSGFNYSTRFTVTTPDTSISGADDYFYSQYIEANNITDFSFGTASAKPLTYSFWVKCSTTGTLSVAFQNYDASRSYVSTVTINAANTWEQKTVFITGDTGGAWYSSSNNGNAIGINVIFSIGNSKPTTANSWQSGNLLGVSGATNFMATNGLTIQFTGAQLEVGTVATSFDFRSYATELALCQRYYVDLANNGGSAQNTYRAIGFCATYTTTQGTYVVQVPVPMRTLPSLTQAGTMYLQNLGTTSVSGFAGPYSMAGTIIEGDFSMVGAVTANITAILRWNNTSTQRFAYSAEL